VVSILTTNKAGQAALGTGFFISADGRVLTCYHVIRDASYIEVLINKQAHSNVQVESINPDHDLAVLSVRGLKQPAPFLRLSQSPPASFAAAALETFGHPSVLKNQHLSVKPTSDAFYQSQDFRDPATGQRLFSLRNVDLIGIDLTVFNGLSGAPLIAGGSVVGVISGSFQQGGSIAWAIPTKYMSALRPVGKPASSIASWPPLSLMEGSFKSLRKQAFFGAGLVLALEQYATSVDKLENVVQSAWADQDFVRMLKILQSAVRRQIKTHGAAYIMNDGIGEAWARELIGSGYSPQATETMSQRMTEFGDALINLSEQLDGDTDKLKEALDQYFQRLPRSAANEKLRATVMSRMKVIEDAFEAWAARMPDFEDDSKTTIGDFEVLFSSLLDDNYLTVAIQRARDYQDVVESVFDAAAAAVARQ
jgi:hypothetical protein